MVAWRHPNMPWDGTEFWAAPLGADGWLEHPRRAAGGADESIFQPGWSPTAPVFRVGSPRLVEFLPRARRAVEAVGPMAADFGRPQWQFGASTCAFADESTILATYPPDGALAERGPRHNPRRFPDRS